MTLGLAFWILMLLWLVAGLWQSWPEPEGKPKWPIVGGSLLLFILLVILGWHAFGPPIRG